MSALPGTIVQASNEHKFRHGIMEDKGQLGARLQYDRSGMLRYYLENLFGRQRLGVLLVFLRLSTRCKWPSPP